MKPTSTHPSTIDYSKMSRYKVWIIRHSPRWLLKHFINKYGQKT